MGSTKWTYHKERSFATSYIFLENFICVLDPLINSWFHVPTTKIPILPKCGTTQIILGIIQLVRTQNLRKNYHFLTPDTHTYVWSLTFIWQTLEVFKFVFSMLANICLHLTYLTWWENTQKHGYLNQWRKRNR